MRRKRSFGITFIPEHDCGELDAHLQETEVSPVLTYEKEETASDMKLVAYCKYVLILLAASAWREAEWLLASPACILKGNLRETAMTLLPAGQPVLIRNQLYNDQGEQCQPAWR